MHPPPRPQVRVNLTLWVSAGQIGIHTLMESGISVSKKGAHRKKILTANENRAASSFGRHPQN
jgi:hypothetical protein